jgi:hypothetical protein
MAAAALLSMRVNENVIRKLRELDTKHYRNIHAMRRRPAIASNSRAGRRHASETGHLRVFAIEHLQPAQEKRPCIQYNIVSSPASGRFLGAAMTRSCSAARR